MDTTEKEKQSQLKKSFETGSMNNLDNWGTEANVPIFLLRQLILGDCLLL